MPGLTDNQLKDTLTAALLRDLSLCVTAIHIGRSDDGEYIAAGVHVDAERSDALNMQLDSWSERMVEQLSKGDIVVTVYALARCCGDD